MRYCSRSHRREVTGTHDTVGLVVGIADIGEGGIVAIVQIDPLEALPIKIYFVEGWL